jgi:hypothetical protein
MKNAIDCLKMKAEIQARIQAATQGMTHAEEIAYIRKLAMKNRALCEKFATAGAKGRHRTAAPKDASGMTVAEWPAPYKRPAKKFDCIKMKEECQAKVRKETEGMSRAELIEYYRRAAEKFGKRFRKVKRPARSARRKR